MAAEGAPLTWAATSFISAPLNCGQAPSSGGTPATGASGGLPTGCQPGCQPAAGFHPAPHDSARSYFSVRTKAIILVVITGNPLVPLFLGAVGLIVWVIAIGLKYILAGRQLRA